MTTRIKCPGYVACKRWFTERPSWRAHAACCCFAQQDAVRRTDKHGKFTYNMNRLTADHERGSITIARRHVPMYEIKNKVEDKIELEEEVDVQPRCPPKEPPLKPVDDCKVVPSGLAAL